MQTRLCSPGHLRSLGCPSAAGAGRWRRCRAWAELDQALQALEHSPGAVRLSLQPGRAQGTQGARHRAGRPGKCYPRASRKPRDSEQQLKEKDGLKGNRAQNKQDSVLPITPGRKVAKLLPNDEPDPGQGSRQCEDCKNAITQHGKTCPTSNKNDQTPREKKIQPRRQKKKE